jgi:hypothetical protein
LLREDTYYIYLAGPRPPVPFWKSFSGSSRIRPEKSTEVHCVIFG